MLTYLKQKLTIYTTNQTNSAYEVLVIAEFQRTFRLYLRLVVYREYILQRA